MFDVVVALDVLEHTEDQSATAEIVRVLKPGGIVIVTVPALPWLWSTRDERAGHRRRYSRRGLVRLLQTHGLQVADVRFYQCLLLPAVIAMRLAGRCWSRTLALEERPTASINRLCLAVNRLEVRLGDHVAWPWGSSVAAVGRKP